MENDPKICSRQRPKLKLSPLHFDPGFDLRRPLWLPGTGALSSQCCDSLSHLCCVQHPWLVVLRHFFVHTSDLGHILKDSLGLRRRKKSLESEVFKIIFPGDSNLRGSQTTL
jgi:hypothetical protein